MSDALVKVDDELPLRTWEQMGFPGPANSPIPKAVVRDAVRVAIQPYVKQLVEAQVAQACGIKYMVARNKAGEFRRVSDVSPRALDALLSDGETIFEVWTKDPSTSAFTDLMNRAIDKPKEQEQEVDIKAKVVFAWMRNEE